MAYFEYKGKKIYYEEKGEGTPLVLLHGNTASSKMFSYIIDLYTDKYRVISIDFLGHGNSERLKEFPLELWFDEAMQTISLLEFLSCDKANLLGTSGGAWVAINVALERPDLVKKVIADSFDGKSLASNFADRLLEQRTLSKKNEMAREFYYLCQGQDWEGVVDNDTNSLLKFAHENISPFHKSLSELQVPLLLTGSNNDDMIRNNFEIEYNNILHEISQGKKYIFQEGFHPSVISNGEEFAKIAKSFLDKI